jgi:hypothetical protein
MRTKRSPGCRSVFAVFQNNPSANAYELLGNGFSTRPIYNTVGDWTRSVGTNLVLANGARFGWSHIALNNGTSWASGVGQFGNTLGIGNGNLQASTGC